MPTVHRKALVPYTPQQMFALVNDVPAYPDFLPWCVRTEVTEQTPEHMVASLILSKGAVQQAFTTENRMVPDRSVEMRLVKGPFRRLHGVWRFEPVGERGCQISLDMDFEFSSSLLALSFDRIFQQIANTLLDAFCQRARDLYSAPR